MEGPLLAEAVVGRTDELCALAGASRRAAGGTGSTVVLTGEPGVGKTRLLREVRSWSEQRGVAVLLGRAVDTATAAPFRPLAEAVMGAYRRGVAVTDPELVPFRGALARLVPDGAADRPADPGAPLLYVAEGFLRVVRQCARSARGAAVLLDDLHWADAETLAVVEYLADNIRDEPILLVLTARPPIGEAAVDALSRLTDRRIATPLPLSRLDAGEVVAMTRECLGDTGVPAEVLRLVVDRADGLPFFVEELLAGLHSDDVLVREGDRWVTRRPPRGRVPATFRESVRVRVGSMDPSARDLLRDAALLGRRVDPHLVAHVTGTDLPRVDEVLRQAADLALVVSSDLGVRFRHALIRDALVADLPADVRARRSHDVLGALRTVRPELPDDLVEVAADLAEAAGERATAAELLRAVGRRALDRGALISAESAHRRAAALAAGTTEEVEAGVALVSTLGLAGRLEDAQPLAESLLGRMAATSSAGHDGSRRLEVHLALARAAAAATDWELASRHLAPARALAAGDADAAGLEALLAAVALGEHRVTDAERHAVAAVEAAARTADPDAECEALLVHGRCLRVHDMGAAARAFERARDVAHGASLAHREARAMTELGFAAGYQDLDETTLLTARAQAEACGAPETEAVADNALAALAATRADPAATQAYAEAGLALARRYRLGQLIPALLIEKAVGLALCGDTDAMEGVLAEAEPLVRGEPMEEIALLTQARATCAFAVDDLALAAAHLHRALEVARRARPTVIPPMLVVAALVRALDGDDTRPLVTELDGWQTDHSPWRLGILSATEVVRTAPDAARASEDGTAPAPDALDRALRGLAPAPFLQAVVTRLVATSAGVHRAVDLSRWLAIAETTFSTLDLPAPAAACRTVRDRRGHRDKGLTVREDEVLALVADGLTNRSIASTLHLSVRTVEKHLERLLAKTGSANRAQLATYTLRRAAVRGADT